MEAFNIFCIFSLKGIYDFADKRIFTSVHICL